MSPLTLLVGSFFRHAGNDNVNASRIAHAASENLFELNVFPSVHTLSFVDNLNVVQIEGGIYCRIAYKADPFELFKLCVAVGDIAQSFPASVWQ